jgi:outer membrane protein assembly complex protein YaeT
MRTSSLVAVSFLGLLAAPAFAMAQANDPGSAITTGTSYLPPPGAVIDKIEFVGLRRIATETARLQLPLQPGEQFDSARLAAGLRSLNRLGWFEDVFVEAEESQGHAETAAGTVTRVRLEFRVREYPSLAGVDFSGSKVLSSRQIRKLLEDKKLSPQAGSAANPANLHHVAVAIRSELAAMGYPDAQVLIARAEQPGGKVRVGFQMQDGPHLPVAGVSFCGRPEVPAPILRKQMRQVSPDAWLSGFRNKNVFTPEKAEEDRLSLLTYLRNHGYPQARVGRPETSVEQAFSSRALPWFHHQSGPGLLLSLPIDSGASYTFGDTEIGASLRQRLTSAGKSDPMRPAIVTGSPFSELAVESQRRAWEMQLHRKAQRKTGAGNYRLRAVTTLDSATHTISVKYDFDPAPVRMVRRIEFRGNRRFPDRYLRRRIGLNEGQPLDEYALQAGMARIERTGYFQPVKNEDIQIKTDEAEGLSDVSIQLHEKGKQRLAFSGGPGQFGSTLGIAYTVFNLLGLDEFLSTQLDGGPESLQLAINLTKEGFLGSRGTLALSVLDTLLLPRLTAGARPPFERAQTKSVTAGWNYAVSDEDSIGINFGRSRSLTEYAVNPQASTASVVVTGVRSETSSDALGIGWAHYSGEQKIQFTESVSGGWLGGNENLLKSKAEYGRIFPDMIFDRRNAWAFRTTVSAKGSYNGNMPVYERFFSGDDLIRGLAPGEFGPYETVATTSPSVATTYSAVPAGANLLGAANLEYRFPLTAGAQGAAFFDAGSGLLLPNWLGPARPALINSTNGLLHGSTGLEVRWTLPVVGIPLRINYSFNILRLNRAVFMPDGSALRLHNPLGVLGWGFGPLF